MGKFGNLSKKDFLIRKCNSCQAVFLKRSPLDYRSKKYRLTVEGDNSVQNYYLLHNQEQRDNLRVLGMKNAKGKVIADIGCGAGSFLDLVKGSAKEVLAIEPNQEYQKELQKKKYRSFSYCVEALPRWKGKVDIVTSFCVLEHVEDPVRFFKEIRDLLKPDGFLLMSTPNRDDWLLDFLPEDYGRFFFRYVHPWYFNAQSLTHLAKRAGFRKVKIRHTQRYDISNALLWIRDRCPTGKGKIKMFQSLDSEYKKLLQKSGRSDLLFAKIYKR
jgi:2-polyprenyl-3-methyl-5-hydroxy-6-metoxy-1,4-benzoquinol methylase